MAAGGRRDDQRDQEGRIVPEDVDYINAHGTSTPYNDRPGRWRQEALATTPTSWPSSPVDDRPLLGAASGAENGITVLAIQHQLVPPTINLDHPDADCDLDFRALQAGRCRPVCVAELRSVRRHGRTLTVQSTVAPGPSRPP
jgi:3-oxoacyl-[acyl-carrier-protein] synthase II